MQKFILESPPVRALKIFTLDIYQLLFDECIKHETYDEQWYYGIIFYDEDNGKYDVIHNYLMGNRIIINNKEGWRDIPFKEATFGFLPAGVKARVL
jgi:hypothetical protein